MKTWLAKSYPLAAALATGSDLEAARHSLRKWEGARPAVLKKHELTKVGFNIIDRPGNFFTFGWLTCALCWRKHAHFRNCRPCVGRRANGKRCYTGTSRTGPYSVFCDTGSVAPMLAWLRKAIALAKKEAKAKVEVRP